MPEPVPGRMHGNFMCKKKLLIHVQIGRVMKIQTARAICLAHSRWQSLSSMSGKQRESKLLVTSREHFALKSETKEPVAFRFTASQPAAGECEKQDGSPFHRMLSPSAPNCWLRDCTVTFSFF